jgi:monoterpene epsilon-lactone hydrolase
MYAPCPLGHLVAAGSDRGFFSNPELPESRDVYDAVVRFFDQHLGK